MLLSVLLGEKRGFRQNRGLVYPNAPVRLVAAYSFSCFSALLLLTVSVAMLIYPAPSRLAALAGILVVAIMPPQAHHALAFSTPAFSPVVHGTVNAFSR